MALKRSIQSYIGKGRDDDLYSGLIVDVNDNDDLWPHSRDHMTKGRNLNKTSNVIKKLLMVLVPFLFIIILLSIISYNGSSLLMSIFYLFKDTRLSEEERRYMQIKAEVEKDAHRHEFELVAVSDRDSASINDAKHEWNSILLRGTLVRRKDGAGEDEPLYKAEWRLDKSPELKSKIVEGRRGMELSELKRFHDRLYAFDDRTGTVFEVSGDNQVLPRYILSEGDGNSPKGFKCEWATVKDGKIIVGSIGKEWTNKHGQITTRDLTWDKNNRQQR
ncbi:apyrase [Acrasis kona]|uniref:Apyrase n=1 Tax=Acrasis kona TaxID=1008807 RepID=A0AAW2Z6M3_9EUKA